MKRASLNALFTLALLGAAFVACDDADTVIAVWDPQLAGGAGGAAGSPSGVGGESGASADQAGAAGAAGAVVPSGNAIYLEAESGAISGGIAIGTDTAASGGQYIVATDAAAAQDMPGDARVTYTFDLTESGAYVIWGRMHAPDAAQNRYWFRLDAGAWTLWRISTGEVWYWDDFHNDTDYSNALSFELAAGPHVLELASAVTGAELDRLYITSQGDKPPGNATNCNPPHSIQVDGQCVPSCGSQGDVTCIPEECANQPLLTSYDCAVCCFVQ